MTDDLLSPDAAGAAPEAAGYTVAEKPAWEGELARLATLDPIEYDRQRTAAADALGCRVSTLDDAVKQRRPMPDAAAGRGMMLAEAEPWPEPVQGAELLDALAAAVLRHVVLPPTAADAAALWVAHTWVAERFQHTPRLAVGSPVKRCGKSTLLEVLRAVCRRPVKADNISASAVFRTVEALAPLTLLLDEAETYLGEAEELRGVLNSGFERNGEVIRVAEIGGEHQPVRFRTFAPLALAGIGQLPGTLEDRAIPVPLQRKGAGESVTKLRAPGARAGLADLARKLARWAADRGRLLPLDPAIPDAMNDREGDISVPLLAVADDAGGVWPARGRVALLALFGRRAAAEGTADAGTLLLADLRDMFAPRPGQSAGPEQLFSDEIVVALNRMEERPWPEWHKDRPITKGQVARILAPFGVRPGTVRRGKGTGKGYKRADLLGAWARYLPAAQPAAPAEEHLPAPGEVSRPVTPSHRRHCAENEPFGAVTRPPGVTDRSGPDAAGNGHCDGVTGPQGDVERKGSRRYLRRVGK